MSVVSLVRLEWEDNTLRWNPSEYSGFSSINISPDEIWVPDIGLYNEIENKDHKKTGITTLVVVNSNGTCRWRYPLFLHVMCSIDVSYFPLDLQKCSLRFGSFSYPSSEMYIAHLKLGNSVPPYKNKEWILFEADTRHTRFWDVKRMSNYSVVEVSFSMERDSVYFFIEMLVPCFLISCLTILGFSPPESGERMSLGMLILLAMTFFQQLTMKMVPLQDFPLISQYFLVTTIEIGVALLITTLTLNFYYHSHSPMPGFMKTMILNYLGKITRIKPPSEDGINTKKLKRSFRLSERKFQLSLSSRETNFDLQSDIELTETGSSRTDVLQGDLNSSTVGLVSFKSMDERSSISSSCDRTARDNKDAMDNIEHVENNEGPNEWNKDWVLASRIIDRFSMYAAVVIGILTVLIVFVRAPRFWSSRTNIGD
ncbi:neuronal acetylcholine receptor subunit alpha-7-like [Dendronephthya gigantea]|uniref:neuronal acetylcholine receptor subunit alpha-7-like n=1 Tax=Dendronephthya gigantea TaxID=151771 RepID=UPI00106BE2C4|nr:neuronal acetylcholine receptor subunit alpha-7-like [Dendronephthya gigantea]